MNAIIRMHELMLVFLSNLLALDILRMLQISIIGYMFHTLGPVVRQMQYGL